MLKTSPKDAVPFLASKWQHLQFLLDLEEMTALLEYLGNVDKPILLFSTMGVAQEGKNVITNANFLDHYGQYIAKLQSGQIPQADDFRFYFTAALTSSDETMQALLIDGGREIIRPLKPIIQLQHHHFDYSVVDKKIRAHVFGPQTISWGLQASYPQLFQDPITRKVENTYNNKAFVNSELFSRLRDWLRFESMPTPFFVEGEKIMSPIRIGKKVLPWINKHPELIARGIQIK